MGFLCSQENISISILLPRTDPEHEFHTYISMHLNDKNIRNKHLKTNEQQILFVYSLSRARSVSGCGASIKGAFLTSATPFPKDRQLSVWKQAG